MSLSLHRSGVESEDNEVEKSKKGWQCGGLLGGKKKGKR